MAAIQYPRPLDADVARLVTQLSPDRREAVEERSGIMQFDAKLPRVEAERRALLHILARYGLVGSSRLRLLQARMGGATHWLLACDGDLARTHLAERGATGIAEVALFETLQAQYGGVAFLGTEP
jgi:hypothetical protein